MEKMRENKVKIPVKVRPTDEIISRRVWTLDEKEMSEAHRLVAMMTRANSAREQESLLRAYR